MSLSRGEFHHLLSPEPEFILRRWGAEGTTAADDSLIRNAGLKGGRRHFISPDDCTSLGSHHHLLTLADFVFWNILITSHPPPPFLFGFPSATSPLLDLSPSAQRPPRLPHHLINLSTSETRARLLIPQDFLVRFQFPFIIKTFYFILWTRVMILHVLGLWLELELVYTGCLQMTLETKMNLYKLGKDGEGEAQSFPETLPEGSKPRLCILADSDEESSSAGSSDEEEVLPSESQGPPGDKNSLAAADGHAGGSTGRKILRFVDKIAKSKYFQKAAENEYIRKKITEFSNMPLMLSVEVQELSGTLAVNIPPPPTDRIWYSFRVPPRLDLHVRPMLGEREVTFTHVTEWIEKKLQCEFQKVFVMPNMDDLYLPLMTSGMDIPPASQHSSVHSSSQQSSVESQEYLSE